MNKDILQGKWKQFSGSIKERWGELTDDDLTESEGNFEQLVGKVQERYGYSRERAEREVTNWMDTQKV